MSKKKLQLQFQSESEFSGWQSAIQSTVALLASMGLSSSSKLGAVSREGSGDQLDSVLLFSSEASKKWREVKVRAVVLFCFVYCRLSLHWCLTISSPGTTGRREPPRVGR